MIESNGTSDIETNIADFIRERNERQSAMFTDPSAQTARQLYRANHPTEILVTKCMDGRLNISLYTETPPGILQPFRNIGGRFDLGWPFFQEVIRDSVNYAIKDKGRQCIVMSSYHFSKGDHHRGCAGFGYDTEGAKKAAFTLRQQFTHVYGNAEYRPVYALTIGIETDEEALIFHGNDGKELNIADLKDSTSPEEIMHLLQNLYPDMNKKMMLDMVPLIEGNICHIKKLRASGREPIDLMHREQVIAVGRGFDWLHMPNTALIVGPYSHQWPAAVKTAGDIVLGNLKEGRIPSDKGVLLLVAALFRQEEGSAGWNLKEEKVRYLHREAEAVLREGVPELLPHLQTIIGVVEADTRKFHELPLS